MTRPICCPTYKWRRELKSVPVVSLWNHFLSEMCHISPPQDTLFWKVLISLKTLILHLYNCTYTHTHTHTHTHVPVATSTHMRQIMPVICILSNFKQTQILNCIFKGKFSYKSDLSRTAWPLIKNKWCLQQQGRERVTLTWFYFSKIKEQAHASWFLQWDFNLITFLIYFKPNRFMISFKCDLKIKASKI